MNEENKIRTILASGVVISCIAYLAFVLEFGYYVSVPLGVLALTMSIYGLIKQYCREKRHKAVISITGNAVVSFSSYKYDNPDTQCRYPDTPMDYCWSYAHHKDGTVGFETMSKICPQCEYWKGVES